MSESASRKEPAECSVSDRLRSWAQNEEMIDQYYLQHGQDCNEAAERIEQLERELAAIVSERATLPECGTRSTSGSSEPTYHIVNGWPVLHLLKDCPHCPRSARQACAHKFFRGRCIHCGEDAPASTRIQER